MNPGSPANQRLYFCCLKHSLQSSVPFATVRRKGLELPLQPRDIRRELRGIEEQQDAERQGLGERRSVGVGAFAFGWLLAVELRDASFSRGILLHSARAVLAGKGLVPGLPDGGWLG